MNYLLRARPLTDNGSLRVMEDLVDGQRLKKTLHLQGWSFRDIAELFLRKTVDIGAWNFTITEAVEMVPGQRIQEVHPPPALSYEQRLTGDDRMFLWAMGVSLHHGGGNDTGT